MSLWSDLSERLRALVRSGRQEREMAEELRFHLERDAEERVRRGADPAAARRAARLALGGVESVKEAVRDARGVRPLQDLAADFRYALRSLRRDPAYATAAILVLGLGLAAATTVFAVANSVLFAPLPYPEPHHLVRVGQLYQGQDTVWQLSTVDAQALQEQQRSFEAFGVVSWSGAALSGAGSPERIRVGRATPGFFRALGVEPVAGRLVIPADEAPDAPPVVVLSHALAAERFGGATAALGRPVTIDGLSHVVVGVLPPGVEELGPGVRADAWPILRLDVPTRRGPFWLRGIGRLREGVSLEAATRDLATISERIFPLWAAGFQDQTARLAPVRLLDSIVGRARGSVGLFAAAVALVWLVGIVNVATLALVRASARAQEVAVRSALGARRLRVARLPLTEGLTVGAAAGVLGLVLAHFALDLVGRLAPGMPRVHELTLGGRTVVVAAAAALLSGLLVSLSPSLAALRGATRWSLRGDLRRSGADRRTEALRNAFVVAEFALALPLLLGASLLVRSLLSLQRVDPGFDPAGAVSVTLALPEARYPGEEETLRFWRQLEAAAGELPGVASAGLASELPPHGIGNVNNFDLVDRPVPAGAAQPMAPWLYVTPDCLEALGVPLLEGRSFTLADSADAPPVALVSRAWTERYYPGETAVGRLMVEGGCTTCPHTTVVGVVGDVKYSGLSGPAEAVYSPHAQSQARSANLVVRSRALPATTFQALRELVARLDPELPMVEQTMAARMADALAGTGRVTATLASFAAVAVALAALGILGVVSYTVRQRRREIGVRIALGADRGAISRMVVGRGMRHAVLGTAIGLGLTLIEARWLEAFLFGVAAHDPFIIGSVVLGLLSVACVACWLPGLRASRIHPVKAIAAE